MIPTELSHLANHLWQSTLFFVAACVVTLALRKNRAVVRYWIWFAASLKFALPFSVLFSISSYLEWRPRLVSRQPHFRHVVDEIGNPFVSSATVSIQTAGPVSSSHLPVILFSVWLCGFVLGLIFLLRFLHQIRAIRRDLLVPPSGVVD
jgi:bla regulator protein blaR1